MKNSNLNDIMNQVTAIDVIFKVQEDMVRNTLMNLYSECQELMDIRDNLDNLSGGDYEFTEDDFLYTIELDKSIVDLPFIDDFFKFGFISRRLETLSTPLTSPIVVNKEHEENEYFVVDLERNEVVIESRGNLMHFQIAKLIKEYQDNVGEDNGVVEVDCNGGYLNHFAMI